MQAPELKYTFGRSPEPRAVRFSRLYAIHFHLTGSVRRQKPIYLTKSVHPHNFNTMTNVTNVTNSNDSLLSCNLEIVQARANISHFLCPVTSNCGWTFNNKSMISSMTSRGTRIEVPNTLYLIQVLQ